MANTSELERDRIRKEKQRKSARDIAIPKAASKSRRSRLEKSTCKWLAFYFPEIFYNPFTDDQKDMINAIEHAGRYGGDQAIAGPRGDGKTRLALFTALKLVVTGALMFPVVVSKSGKIAERELTNIKDELLYNDKFAADYPEICEPLRLIEGSTARARLQTHQGNPTRISWRADHIILPTIKGSRASGRILSSVGIEGAIRGMNYRNVRPDLAIIDDIDDRESAKSQMQTDDRSRTIDEDIAGLGGQGKRCARVMLCTLLNRTCAAARFTDPKIYPSWKGRRFGMVKVWPTKMEMWDEYIKLRRDRDPLDDPDARQAHRYYTKHRKLMDRGSVVSNPARFVASPLQDGKPAEVSALQHAFNWIADIGQDAFDTEYQNDPPESAGPETNGITALLVRSRINGGDQRVVPAWCERVTAAIDIRKRWLDWSVFGWKQGAIADVVDYGEDPVASTDGMTAEDAILLALQDRRDAWTIDGEECVVTPDGEPRSIDLVLVDSGNWTTTVYKFCNESDNTWHPSMGLSKYRAKKKTPKVHPGDNWYWSRQDDGMWLVDMNTYHWISWLHERFITEPLDDGGYRRRGSVTLFGSQPMLHTDFAKQIVSEVYRTEFIEGKGEVGSWYKSGPNHKLDTAYMNCVAASILGIRLLPPAPAKQTKAKTGPRVKPGITSPDGRPFMASNR